MTKGSDRLGLKEVSTDELEGEREEIQNDTRLLLELNFTTWTIRKILVQVDKNPIHQIFPREKDKPLKLEQLHPDIKESIARYLKSSVQNALRGLEVPERFLSVLDPEHFGCPENPKELLRELYQWAMSYGPSSIQPLLFDLRPIWEC